MKKLKNLFAQYERQLKPDAPKEESPTLITKQKARVDSAPATTAPVTKDKPRAPSTEAAVPLQVASTTTQEEIDDSLLIEMLKRRLASPQGKWKQLVQDILKQQEPCSKKPPVSRSKEDEEFKVSSPLPSSTSSAREHRNKRQRASKTKAKQFIKEGRVRGYAEPLTHEQIERMDQEDQEEEMNADDINSEEEEEEEMMEQEENSSDLEGFVADDDEVEHATIYDDDNEEEEEASFSTSEEEDDDNDQEDEEEEEEEDDEEDKLIVPLRSSSKQKAKEDEQKSETVSNTKTSLLDVDDDDENIIIVPPKKGLGLVVHQDKTAPPSKKQDPMALEEEEEEKKQEQKKKKEPAQKKRKREQDSDSEEENDSSRPVTTAKPKKTLRLETSGEASNDSDAIKGYETYASQLRAFEGSQLSDRMNALRNYPLYPKERMYLDPSEVAKSMTGPDGFPLSEKLNHPKLWARLKDFQAKGVQCILTRHCASNLRGFLLSDDMGLGKTIQTLVFINSLFAVKSSQSRFVYIVCPASTVTNWWREARAWAPNCTHCVVFDKEYKEKNRTFFETYFGHWEETEKKKKKRSKRSKEEIEAEPDKPPSAEMMERLAKRKRLSEPETINCILVCSPDFMHLHSNKLEQWHVTEFDYSTGRRMCPKKENTYYSEILSDAAKSLPNRPWKICDSVPQWSGERHLTFVLDEAHQVVNKKTNVKRHTMCSMLTRSRVLLSGTPMQNKMDDFYYLVDSLFLNDAILPSYPDYKTQILCHMERASKRMNHDSVEKASTAIAMQKLSSVTTPFSLRREKHHHDVMGNSKLHEITIFVNLKEKQRSEYDSVIGSEGFSKARREAKEEDIDAETKAKLKEYIFSLIQQMRQLCISSWLVGAIQEVPCKKDGNKTTADTSNKKDRDAVMVFEDDDDYEEESEQDCEEEVSPKKSKKKRGSKKLQDKDDDGDMEQGGSKKKEKTKKEIVKPFPSHEELMESAKIELVVKMVKRFMQMGEKTLVFANNVLPLRLVRLALQHEGIPAFEFYGITKSQVKEEIIYKVNNDKAACVVLISVKCGGAGITLTGATRVIMLDPWWNPTIEEQAICRAYRMGQKKNVFAYRIMCGGTVEPIMLQIQIQKKTLSQGINSKEIRTALDQSDMLKVLEQWAGMPVGDTMKKLQDLCHHIPVDPELENEERFIMEKYSDVVIGTLRHAMIFHKDSKATKLNAKDHEEEFKKQMSSDYINGKVERFTSEEQVEDYDKEEEEKKKKEEEEEGENKKEETRAVYEILSNLHGHSASLPVVKKAHPPGSTAVPYYAQEMSELEDFCGMVLSSEQVESIKPAHIRRVPSRT
jgi:SNF2 family DNA or RNA helicase